MRELDGRRLYRIGVTPDCPVHQVTIGGQNFTRRSEVVSGYGSETKRREIQGSIVRLNDSEIKTIKAAAERKVLRSTRGKKVVARVHSKDARNYSQREGDQDVSGFVYVHPEQIDPTQENTYETLGGTTDEPTPKRRRS